MVPRRAFLIRSIHVAVGATLGTACGGREQTTGPSTSQQPADVGTSTSTSTLPPAAVTTVAPATVAPATVAPATVAPATVAPWAGADFGELDEFLAATNGDAFVIVEAGVIVHEWSRLSVPPGRDIASAQKSVLSLLVGRGIADGHFALDTLIDDVLGSGWAPHDQTSQITVRHLLTMTSGLDDDLAVVTPPGTAWLYSGAFAQLFDVLTTTTGRELGDLADQWLFGPVGASTARFYRRRSTNFAPIGLFASVADLAAIGTAVADGTLPGLPDTWLDESLAPTQDFNQSYGYLWWLNGQTSFLLPGPGRIARAGPLIPGAPADLVAALGKDDQKLYISRELSLVVARLGGKAVPEVTLALSSFDAQLWTMLERLRGEP